MKYPKLLKNNDLIGITALSSGASDCKEEMELAIDNLNKIFRVEVTKNVFGSSLVSSSKKQRIDELNALLDQNIKGIIIARGGDFLLEIIDDIDYKKIKKKNIWV